MCAYPCTYVYEWFLFTDVQVCGVGAHVHVWDMHVRTGKNLRYGGIQIRKNHQALCYHYERCRNKYLFFLYLTLYHFIH